MNRNKISIFLHFTLILFFISPYVYLYYSSPAAGEIRWDWAVSAFFESFKQASIVVLCCFIFSILFWRSVFSLSEANRSLVKKILYAPILLPPIFTILIGFQLFHPFPFGLLGISILFILTYLGFFFSVIIETIEFRFLRQIVIQNAFGIHWLKFDLFVLLPQLKNSYFYLGLIVFVSCFSSLSIPMIASGGKSTNFELFIFESVFIQNNWKAAILLSTIQAVMLFLFSELLFRFGYNQPLHAKVQQTLPTVHLFRKTKWMLVFPFTYLISYFGIFSFKFVSSMAQFSLRSDEWNLILSATLNSIGIFLCVSVLTLGFSFVILFRKFCGSTNRFLVFFLNPSTAVIGIAFFLVSFPIQDEFIRTVLNALKLSFGLFFVIGISIYFTFLNSKSEQLTRQFVIARAYGLSFRIFLTSILLPQMQKNYITMLSMLFLFVMTEFALTAVVGLEFRTLGSVLYSYASSYRLNLAIGLLGLVLFVWALLTILIQKLFFRGLQNV